MKFADIIGQEEIIARLRSMADNNRIPHAILLSGDYGTPKLQLAQAFAQYLHCQSLVDGDCCGRCPSCLQHQSFNHADTFFSFPVVKKDKIDTSDDFIDDWRNFLSNGKVETLQRWLAELNSEEKQPRIYVHESEKIIHKMSMAAYSSQYKVLIMWLPEKMNVECANALLKIIEEPYPDSIFILVSDNSAEILPTIHSRTQEIHIKRPTISDTANYLIQKHDVDSDQAQYIANLVQGNIAAAEDEIKDTSENDKFLADFISLMRLAYKSDLYELKRLTEKIEGYKREKIRRFLSYCCHMIRENYIYNLQNPQLMQLNSQEDAFSSKFHPFINETNTEEIIHELDLAESDIARNANAKIVLFDMAIKLTIRLNRNKKK